MPWNFDKAGIDKRIFTSTWGGIAKRIPRNGQG
jgi:hypothetical protein